MLAANSAQAGSIIWIRNWIPLEEVFCKSVFPRLFSVHFIVQLNIFTFGASLIVALSAYLVIFINVEQRTPGKSRSSSTLSASYAKLLEGNTIEYPLVEEVNVIVFSKFIGNWGTDLFIVCLVGS